MKLAGEPSSEFLNLLKEKNCLILEWYFQLFFFSIFSITGRSRSDGSEWVSPSLTNSRLASDVALVSDDTYWIFDWYDSSNWWRWHSPQIAKSSGYHHHCHVGNYDVVFSNDSHFHLLSLLICDPHFLSLKLTVRRGQQSLIRGDGSRSYRWWLRWKWGQCRCSLQKHKK